MKKWLFFTLLLSFKFVFAQNLYFPPVVGNTWETVSPQTSMNWCPSKIDSLRQFLTTKNTKAFIVLKNGRIAIEWYFGTFTQDSAWYWASAGKSLTSFLAGMAQQEGILNIQDSTSKYLGVGWTSLTPVQEGKIKVVHQLSMSSGLDDGVADDNCTTPQCLTYKAEPNTRWAYHNGVYHLIHNVIEKASGLTINQFTTQRLQTKTGITGLWLDHIFYSKPRSAARFGLLALANGVWNGEQLLRDTAYWRQSINTSQPMNKSYGYLWWLNGKGEHMLPQIRLVYPSDIVPAAPRDMYAALGKNDQKIYVVRSQNLVVVRMGDASGIPLYALSNFDNELWEKLSKMTCTSSSEVITEQDIKVSPNPVASSLDLDLPENMLNTEGGIFLTNLTGQVYNLGILKSHISVSNLPNGLYILTIQTNNRLYKAKISILH
ncbi:MAG: serine hydrolase [Saprospiraceae bacterium]|nr:serine hydrolase [Saprospiraceae bacterium]